MTFTGTVTGHRLWVLLVDELNGQFYGTNVLSPTSPYSYTINGVQPGNYFTFASWTWMTTAISLLAIKFRSSNC